LQTKKVGGTKINVMKKVILMLSFVTFGVGVTNAQNDEEKKIIEEFRSNAKMIKSKLIIKYNSIPADEMDNFLENSVTYAQGLIAKDKITDEEFSQLVKTIGYSTKDEYINDISKLHESFRKYFTIKGIDIPGRVSQNNPDDFSTSNNELYDVSNDNGAGGEAPNPCKEALDIAVNDCFWTFVNNQAGCFPACFGAIGNPTQAALCAMCHVQSILNQLNCNMTARANYRLCFKNLH
jgi:hypothetical protein